MSVFYVVLNKTVIMMALIAIGYLLGRKGVVSRQAGRDLAVLETRFFLPAYLFTVLSENLDAQKLRVNLGLLLFGLVFFVVLIVLSFLLSRTVRGEPLERFMAFYMLNYPNYGYFGYPVVLAAYGPEVLTQYIIFALPITLSINTYGAWLLTTRRSQSPHEKFTPKSLLALPFEVFAAVIFGALCGLLDLPLPGVVGEFFSFSAACMSPVAMLLTGLILSTLPPGKIFGSGKAYYFNALKLVILPAITGSVFYLVGLRGIYLAFPVVMSAMPVGMNVVIFSRPEQPDYQSSGVTCFISYVIALLTVPAVFGLLSLVI